MHYAKYKRKSLAPAVFACLFLLSGLFVNITLAANKYWVAPLDGLANVSANWSLTSGGAGGASVPNMYDVVNFDSGSVKNATINADMTVADFIINSNYSGIVSVAEGVMLTVGSAVEFTPVVSVVESGQQIATTTLPATDQNIGGAFMFSAQGAATNITNIKIKQSGSLSTSSISNIRLFSKNAEGGECSATMPSSGTTLFGTASEFDSNNIATTTAPTPLALTVDVPVCVYVVYDLLGEPSIYTMGKTVDIVIDDPVVDVIISSGTIISNARVNITGVTMIAMSSSVGNTVPNTSNPACSNSAVYSMLSVNVHDSIKDPTLFYLQNCAVWKKEGDGAPRRLTNPNLQVHVLRFTDLTGINSAGTVKIDMTISNVNIGADPTFLNVTRTYGTTASIKASPGN